MVVQPHFTVPVNIRPQDRLLMDAALEIVRNENKSMTWLFRQALQEYVEKRKIGKGSLRLEEYFETLRPQATGSLEKVLSREELAKWGDQELLATAKKVKARVEELQAELKRRGFLFILRF
ncbi:MAG: hypothetical protein ACHQ1H_04685 [Nitrososphaerales archaeon]